MTECIQVTTAIDSQESAQNIADALVKARLAACVHVSGPILSTYWWQETIEKAEEWICTAKTRKELAPELMEALRGLHSYDEPEIIVVPIIAGSQGYLNWIVQETTKHDREI